MNILERKGVKGSSEGNLFQLSSPINKLPMSLSPNSLGKKRFFINASPKEIYQWQEDLKKISKEELLLKRNLKEINLQHAKIVERYPLSLYEFSPDDKKQKELQRSLKYINTLLKIKRSSYKSLTN